MPKDGSTIRRVLLEVVQEKASQGPGFFQTAPVLRDAASKLELQGEDEERALLTVWADLFRMGFLAWGHNLANADPPHIHITEAGHKSLENLSRDPYNPDGYMATVSPHLDPDSVALSYVREAVGTFSGGFLKASAVMVGAASEALVLDLRDALVNKLEAEGTQVSKGLNDWKIKTIRDEIAKEITSRKSNMDRKLFERFSAYWTAMTDQVRMARNDAGHPASVDPVTHETVHAGLLLFPELARLTRDLKGWLLNLS